MAPKGRLPLAKARRATSNERRRKCSSSSDGLIFDMLSMAAPCSFDHAEGRCGRQASGSGHDPEKHTLGLRPDGWKPVFGKDHAQRKIATGLIQRSWIRL